MSEKDGGSAERHTQTQPNTERLAGSGLAVDGAVDGAVDDGVPCDPGCVTGLGNVVAVGDVARVRGRRVEHWTTAARQPAVAVRNLLAGHTVEHWRHAPYFWSDQYGVRIQFTGEVLPTDAVRIVEGSVADRSFLACYERDGVVVGALGFNRLRRELPGHRPQRVS